jgi:WD40 repeat protein
VLVEGVRSNRDRTADERRDYDAFISYSHEADASLAPVLQDGLHRFAKPWYRLRALHVFRDESSLSANPALWPSVERALRASRWFLLLASPAAARSKWVAREVEFWLAREPADRLLIVLTDGAIVWNDETQSFDRDATISLPAALLDVYEQEPRFVDLRWARSAGTPSLHDETFRRAVADVAAPLHGRDKDDLLGEDVRQHTRALRLARTTAVTLLVLLVAAIVAAVLAVSSRNDAIAQKNLALSRALAAGAIPKLQTDPTVGMLLSVEAIHFVEGRAPARTADARSSVLTAFERDRRLRASWPAIAKDVAFVGDRHVISSNLAGGLSVFEVPSKRSLGLVAVPGGAVSSVAASSDSGLLAAATVNGAIRLWRPVGRDAHATLAPLGPLVSPDVGKGLAHRGFVSALALSADGSLLASGGFKDGAVRLWDTASGRQLAKLGVAGEPILAVTLSSDGRTLLAGAAHARLGVWSLTRRPTLRVTALGPFDLGMDRIGDVAAIACKGDCRTVAIASSGGIWLGDVAELRSDRAIASSMTNIPGTLNSGLHDLVFSADGSTLASAHSDGTVRLWDVATRASREQPLGAAVSSVAGLSDVYALAFSPNGRLLASSGGGGVKVWSMAGRSPLGEPMGRHDRKAYGLAVSRDGRIAATGGDDPDTQVRLWDLVSRRQLRALSTPGGAVVPAVAFSPDGTVLIAGVDGKAAAANGIVLWRASSPESIGEAAPRFVKNPDGRAVVSVAFSPDGRWLASTDGGPAIQLWSLPEFHPVGTLSSGRTAVTGVPAFSGDGSTLAAGYQDGYVRLWRVTDPRSARRALRVSLDPVAVVALSRDGRVLAEAGRDGEIALWGLRQDTPSHRLLGGTIGSLGRLVFSPDGDTLVSAGGDGIRLWDVGQGIQLGDVLAPLSMTADVAFAPTAHDLISVSVGDGAVRLWRGVTDVAVISRRLCAVAGRSLTRSEWRLNVPGEPYRATCGRH